MTTLKPGDKAPAFSGKDQSGNTISLSDFSGKKVVLYFYPKDDTPGCTKEACNFRDNQALLQQKGIIVLGVSPDSEKSHLKFIDKFSLNFPLIADTDKVIANAYGVWGPKKFMGRAYDGVHRTTFIIDEKGILEKVITKVDVENSTEQIVKELGL
jgi:thioredoxin-dependent peroxiredoxin